VVAVKSDSTLRLTALDRKATAFGLRTGMPLANARAMLPALMAMPANETADLKLLEGIADWCLRFTPFVALDPPRALLLDVTGTTHLFGGEQEMLDNIRTRISKQGFAVRAALAGTAAAAQALAYCRDYTVVQPGEDANAVFPLPVEALRLGSETTHALRRAGLKTIGQVASRQRAELTARFGKAMVAALDAALGQDQTPISPRLPLPDYSTEHRFAEPIVTQEAVLGTLCRLTATLAAALTERGNGARRLEAVFFRADGAVRRIAIETGEPTRDPKTVDRLFREKLDALADPLDPGFGYDLIRLEASRIERANAQTADFDANAHEEKELRFLVDRLAARFGSQRILAFQPNDTHIPESAWAAVPAQYAGASKRDWENIRETKEAPRRPIRMFAKPEAVDVTAVDPFTFHWRRMRHVAVRVEGPERIAMEWWRHQRPQPTRDYYRVEDGDGRRFWLYHDGVFEPGRVMTRTLSSRWFIHGVFA
jgi:protein ImuB